MQIINIMKYNFTSTKMAMIKRKEKTHFNEDSEQLQDYLLLQECKIA